MRREIDLNGIWKLNGRDVIVPSCWPVDFTTGNTLPSEGTYSKEIYVDEQERGKRVILRFYGVDHHADVWMNKKYVGSHEGGYSRFEFDVTPYILFGTDNSIEVRVKDVDPDSPAYSHILHGKQDWYGNVSGIWQPVEMLITDMPYIKDVRIYPDINENLIRLFLKSDGIGRKDIYVIECKILDEEDSVIEKEEFVLSGPTRKIIWRFEGQLIPWSPDNPYLYRLKIDLYHDGKVDESITRFGMREIRVKNGRFLLNGNPFYMIGVLDQAFYPETFYTEPDKEYLKREFELAKRMGINTLRCHVKIPHDIYLEAADKVGLLVWIDLPYANEMDTKSKNANRILTEETLRRFANHPSFVILSLINEGWGLSLSESEADRKWLKESYSLAKKLDPSRLIVDNSPCRGNFHVKSDIDDWHLYSAYPEHAEEWSTSLDSFIDERVKTFWDRRSARNSPKIVSELGLWGIPYVDSEEDWMKLSPFDFERFSPKGVEERFKRFHIDEFYPSLEKMCKITQMQEFYGLKYQIEEIRKRDAIQGYVITEFTDILWEANGLLDFYRRPKVFYPLLKDINNPVTLLIDPPISELVVNEVKRISIVISNETPSALSNVNLRYGFENVGFKVENIGRIDAFSNHILKNVYISPPYTEINADHRFALELRKGNELVARNSYTMRVYNPSTLPDDLVITDDPARLKNIASDRILFCIVKEPEDKSYLRKMGIDIMREDERPSALPFAPWEGDWMSTFIYYDRKRFRNSLGDDYTGIHLKPFLTRFLIDIEEPELFKSVIIGKFIGWIYDVAALVIRVKYKGKDVIVTTLDLMESDILRDNLIKDIIK